MIVILCSVNVVSYVDPFACVEPGLCPWDEPHLIVMYYFYNVLLCSILFRFLHLYSSEIVACTFLFCVLTLLGLGFCWPHKVSLEVFLFFDFFGEF